MNKILTDEEVYQLEYDFIGNVDTYFELIRNIEQKVFEKVEKKVEELIKWIELTDHMKETGKYEHMIHKSHLKKRIRKIFGEKLRGGE